MATLSEAFAIALEHLRAGRHDLAEEIGRRILAVEPGHAAAWHLLGQIDHWAKRLTPAAEGFARAVALEPTNPGYHNDLGVVLGEQGNLDGAIACYRRTVELDPDCVPAYINLGNVLQSRGKLDEAIVAYRRAVQLKPDGAAAHNNLGGVWLRRGNPDEAVACFRRAIELDPNYAHAYSNIAPALQALGRVDEAIACCQRAVQLKPDFPDAYANLAYSLQDRGQIREAIACFQRALELRPGDATNHSNLIFAMLFSSDLDPATIFEEHRRWNDRHAKPLAALRRPHPNDRSPERRLRIGYVSNDFRWHPAGLFALPLLEAHDRAGFEIYGYSSTAMEDEITHRCQAAADGWRDMRGFSDAQLADVVREDRIDVLVDLTMHSAGCRLLTLAEKPAPVQVTYLAYCGTTGVDGVDYRLTDPYLDPPGADQRYYSEQSVRLPETYWCYQPSVETQAVNRLPALETGRITFGCLSNSAKLSEPALAVWANLLKALPSSRLLLHARAGGQRDRVRQLLVGQGVEAERLEFVDRLPRPEYFATYQRIDVALDPFPYSGGTTTCDALWMGVPVVSLAGRTAVGRGGVSILSNVGMPELVARDVEQYIRIAVELAGDLARLAELRAGLRERMQKSPLMDAPRFARNVEAAYRAMWRQWCATPSPTAVGGR